jgi:hypothetical protein
MKKERKGKKEIEEKKSKVKNNKRWKERKIKEKTKRKRYSRKERKGKRKKEIENKKKEKLTYLCSWAAGPKRSSRRQLRTAPRIASDWSTVTVFAPARTGGAGLWPCFRPCLVTRLGGGQFCAVSPWAL